MPELIPTAAEAETFLKSPFALLMCPMCNEIVRDLAEGRIKSIERMDGCLMINREGEGSNDGCKPK